jgi:FmdE protein associated with molybdenum formylmethanofuran dehydrogenase
MSVMGRIERPTQSERLLRMSVRAVLCSAVILLSLPAWAETPNEWIELGARVHGAFGAFIPIGIRIGLDAKERIKAEARGLAVTYYTGEKAPCPCIADGVMLATNASPGQGTLVIAPEKARVCATPSPTRGCRRSWNGTRPLIPRGASRLR